MPFIGPKPADTVLDSTLIADGTITSAKIKDGEIVNADLNSSAAIATSKISGLATSATTDTTNASNINSGTLPDARLSNQVKVVKSGSAPSNPQEGDLWYDTTNNILKNYESSASAFIKVAAEPATLSSVSGTLYSGQTSNLTLAGAGFLTSGLVVNFLQTDDSINANVTVTPTSDTAATVAVPSAVYNNVTVGRVVTIKVTNSDSRVSGNQTITATSAPYTTDFLVIGGGGRGGYEGGGGAGGYRNSYASETSGRGASSQTALTLSAGTVYTITIGAGTAGGTETSGTPVTAAGSSITGSDITNVTTTGGGGGGYAGSSDKSGANGGCGGGGASSNGAGGSGTTGEGYDGGTNAGGGGGAGSAGSNGHGGQGGAGLTSSITGSSVARASGGSGAPSSAGTVAAQAGGGGAGKYNGDAGDGTANTGGGGGGFWAGGQGTAGDGGSGVVILRMATANYSGTTSGSPTVAQSGSDTILTFTGSGSYTG